MNFAHGKHGNQSLAISTAWFHPGPTISHLPIFKPQGSGPIIAVVVNLETGDCPEDIYQAFADRLLELVIDKADHHAGEERRPNCGCV